MRAVSLLVLLLCLVGPVNAQNGTSTVACFTNSTVLNDVIELGSYSKQKTYVICPNTVMNIGWPSNADCCVNGSVPFTPRANTLIKCGDSGSIKNNCTLRGGDSHVITTYLIYGGDIAQNIVIQGFAFEGSNYTNVFAANRGDVTFVDCIFKNNANLAPIFGVYFKLPSRRRAELMRKTEGLTSTQAIAMALDREYISSLMDKEHKHDDAEVEVDDYYLDLVEHQDRNLRQLQVPDKSILTFNNCTFESNRQGPLETRFMKNGVIWMQDESNDLVIAKNSVFRNNIYGKDKGASTGYAVQSEGGNITVTDTCVLGNNRFHGLGAFQVFGGSLNYSRVYGPRAADLTCSFAAISSSTSSTSPVNVTCVDNDLTSCPFARTQAASNNTQLPNKTSAPSATVSTTVPRGTPAPVTSAPIGTLATPAPSSHTTALVFTSEPIDTLAHNGTPSPKVTSAPNGTLPPNRTPSPKVTFAPNRTPLLKMTSAPNRVNNTSGALRRWLAAPVAFSTVVAAISSICMSWQ